jgi:hypothetical protein
MIFDCCHRWLFFYIQAAVAGKKGGKQHGKDKQPAFVHPWLLTSLKGHSGRVLDINLR